MNYKIKHDKKIVIGFTLVSFGLFIGLLFLVAVNNKVFKQKMHYYTVLDTAYGLDQFPSIFFKGYEIGAIEKFELTDDNHIRVYFFIYKDFSARMLKYSVISKNMNPISKGISEFELIIPKKITKNYIKPGGYVPLSTSELGKKYIKEGRVFVEDEGIAGIIRKLNNILDQFLENNTAGNINQIVAETLKTMTALDETIRSYSARETSKGSEEVVKILKSARKSLDHVTETLKYVKETLGEVHKNRKDIAPLLINTTKTLRKAQDTLQGINNNPLIKDGIKKRDTSIDVEITD